MKTEQVIDYIVGWLKDYATKANVNGFVVGVSGGIDSAVTSTLCAKTGMPTLCIEMPIHQAASHVSRAQEHIKQLKDIYRLEAPRLYAQAWQESLDKCRVSCVMQASAHVINIYIYSAING